MTQRAFKSFLWDTVAVLSVALGVLGSLCAWEAGGISLFRMLLQVCLFGSFAYTALCTAAAVRRTRRHRAAHRAAHCPRTAVAVSHAA